MRVPSVVASSVLAVVLTVAAPSGAQAVDEISSLRLKIFFKIMTYDLNLPADSQAVRVGVLIPGRDTGTASYKALRGLFANYSGTRVKGKPFEIVELAYDRPQEIPTIAAAANLYALFVTNSVPAADVAAIVSTANKERLLTFAEASDLVVLGIDAGVEVVDARPRILINAGAAKASGRALDSALIGLARVIQ